MGTAVARACLPGMASAATVSDFSSAALGNIEREAARLGLVALIIRNRGSDVLSWGDPARVCGVHSMRKSLLSALFGQAIATGAIDPASTLGSIGIDDDPPLTPIEKAATIQDLLEARSGIYLPLAPGMQPLIDRPARGAYAPGTHWCYNNWDFNALGEIYRRLTGKGVFEAIGHNLAVPLGFEDFDPYRDGRYVFGRDALGATARYPNYRLSLSARDQARFGELYLHRGARQGRVIVPEDWVDRSLVARSATGRSGSAAGYGYLWWVGAIGGVRVASAVGAYGHVTAVLPDLGTVVVIQPDTDGAIPHPLAATQTDALLASIIALHSPHLPSGDKE